MSRLWNPRKIERRSDQGMRLAQWMLEQTSVAFRPGGVAILQSGVDRIRGRLVEDRRPSRVIGWEQIRIL